MEIFKKTQPQYKFYLRHHNWGATETVLYAITKRLSKKEKIWYTEI